METAKPVCNELRRLALEISELNIEGPTRTPSTSLLITNIHHHTKCTSKLSHYVSPYCAMIGVQLLPYRFSSVNIMVQLY